MRSEHRAPDPIVARGPVVAGVDGSAGSLRAVRVAAVEADRRGVALHLLHAAQPRLGIPGPGRAAAGRAFDLARAAALTAAPGLAVRVFPRTGPAVGALLDAARDADLLVVGSRGHGPVTAALLGSVAFGVTAAAPCPVLVVRGDHAPAADAPVAVGVEGSARDLAALEFAFAEAQLHRVPLLAVHGWGALLAPLAVGVLPRLIPDDGALAGAAVREVLKPFRERFPDVGVQARAVTDRADAVLQRASCHARLLVVGTRGRAVLPALLLGSVTLHALHESRCPVAVIPGARTASLLAAGAVTARRVLTGPGSAGTGRDVGPSRGSVPASDHGSTAENTPEVSTP